MHLADGEVTETEGEVRRDEGVWRLLVRQRDIEPDRSGPHLPGAAVRRFHDPGPPPVTTTKSRRCSS